jgi:hypothetical protein
MFWATTDSPETTDAATGTSDSFSVRFWAVMTTSDSTLEESVDRDSARILAGDSAATAASTTNFAFMICFASSQFLAVTQQVPGPVAACLN